MKTTKELARELGLLRKRSVSSPGQNKNKRRKIIRQIFQYLIVLDFESTCWSNTKLIPQEIRQIFQYLIVLDFESTCWSNTKLIPQEIIEFPAVLMNTSNGAIESEFHHYVQPQEKPILSEFCCQLTGISQEQVDDGIPLNFCLKRFSQWLEKLYKEKNIQYFSTPEQNSNLCTFVTWSDWDLGLCLKNECKRKQLRKPTELNQWIDLRATYKKFYERKPNGLNGALNDLGITFQGREHSGLDDARNTACLAWRMIQDGCVLTITKSLSGAPKPVLLDKPPEKCLVVKEIPTFQNGKESEARNPGTNDGFKTPQSVCRQNTNPGKKTNTPKKNITLKNKKNSPPKRSESPLQSKVHKDSKIPQALVKFKDTLVPKSSDSKYKTMNNLSTTIPSKSTLVGNSSIPTIPAQPQSNQIQVHKKFTVYTDTENSNTKNDQVSKKDSKTINNLSMPISKSTPIGISPTTFPQQKQSSRIQINKNFTVYTDSENRNPNFSKNDSKTITNLSTSIPSKSTPIPSSSNPIPPQSNRIQVNKNFTVYTDSENSYTKNDQVPKKDFSFSKSKTNVSQTANHSKISTPSLAIKDISNTFITPKSLPPAKSGNATSLKTPPLAVKDSSNTFITPTSLPPVRSGSATTLKTPSLAIKDISNTFITPTSLPPVKSGSANTSTYPRSNPSKMKSTPPLCNCGRRAKFSISHTPGANMGRKFFTCGLKGSNLKSRNRSVTACNFFKWDTDHVSVFLSNQSLQSSSLMQSSVLNSSKSKENYNGYNSSTSSLGTNSAENTPVLKKTKLRPYQLL